MKYLHSELSKIKNHSYIGIALLFVSLFLISANKINAQGDFSPPRLLMIDIDRNAINVNPDPQTVTAFLQVSDNLSGLDYGQVIYISPSGQRLTTRFGAAERYAGTPTFGYYRVNLIFPVGSEPATWFPNIFLADVARNNRTYDGIFPSTGSLYINVINVPDNATPEIQSFSFSPTSVNTSTSFALVTVTVRITDDASGFRDGTISFLSPNGHERIQFNVYSYDRIAGNERDGTYRAYFRVYQYAPTGTWCLEYLRILDVSQNVRTYSLQQAVESGFQTDLRVNSNPANVMVGGRVKTSIGRGIFRARVSLTDSQGITQTALTNSFGYFRFTGLTAEETYQITITHMRYQFGQHLFTVTQPTMDLNFTPTN